MHLHHHSMAVGTVVEHDDPHAALAPEVDRRPGFARDRPPEQRGADVGRQPAAATAPAGDPTAEQGVPFGRRRDRLLQEVGVERTTDPAFKKEAHGESGPLLDEHELLEGGQVPRCVGARRMGGGLGIHRPTTLHSGSARDAQTRNSGPERPVSLPH